MSISYRQSDWQDYMDFQRPLVLSFYTVNAVDGEPYLALEIPENWKNFEHMGVFLETINKVWRSELSHGKYLLQWDLRSDMGEVNTNKLYKMMQALASVDEWDFEFIESDMESWAKEGTHFVYRAEIIKND